MLAPGTWVYHPATRLHAVVVGSIPGSDLLFVVVAGRHQALPATMEGRLLWVDHPAAPRGRLVPRVDAGGVSPGMPAYRCGGWGAVRGDDVAGGGPEGIAVSTDGRTVMVLLDRAEA